MKKSKMEFSKKIFYVVITLFVVIIFYSMALMWKTESTDALAYLIPSVSGLTATTIGFYYNKAKLENQIKLSQMYGIDLGAVQTLDDSTENYSEEE